MRILIVDDDRDNADALAVLFSRAGHTADVAYDEHTARTMLAPVRAYDAVIMDWLLGSSTGGRVLGWMRGLGDRTPVALMTGAVGPDWDAASLAARAWPNVIAIRKPFDPRHLPNMLRGMGEADTGSGAERPSGTEDRKSVV